MIRIETKVSPQQYRETMKDLYEKVAATDIALSASTVVQTYCQRTYGEWFRDQGEVWVLFYAGATCEQSAYRKLEGVDRPALWCLDQNLTVIWTFRDESDGGTSDEGLATLFKLTFGGC